MFRQSSQCFFSSRFGARRTILVAALSCLGWYVCMITSVAESEDEPAAKKTVRLVIDFGDGPPCQEANLHQLNVAKS